MQRGKVEVKQKLGMGTRTKCGKRTHRLRSAEEGQTRHARRKSAAAESADGAEEGDGEKGAHFSRLFRKRRSGERCCTLRNRYRRSVNSGLCAGRCSRNAAVGLQRRYFAQFEGERRKMREPTSRQSVTVGQTDEDNRLPEMHERPRPPGEMGG